jgi:hypothetical protein
MFFLAREFQSVYGSWPQVFVDTPWDRLGNVSPKYDALFRIATYLEAFSGAWMVIFSLLFFTVRSRLSVLQGWICLSLMFISLFLVLIDPGNLYEWWMD